MWRLHGESRVRTSNVVHDRVEIRAIVSEMLGGLSERFRENPEPHDEARLPACSSCEFHKLPTDRTSRISFEMSIVFGITRGPELSHTSLIPWYAMSRIRLVPNLIAASIRPDLWTM